MLHEFVTANREEIIRRCRAKVAMRSVPPATEAEVNHGVPLFLDQLVDALRLGQSSSLDIGKSAVLHGRDPLLQGDECGGLVGGDANNLFHPFEQRSANRTGLGLGLAFSRWGAEANDGRIYARTLPDVGCVFTVDLPRVAASVLAIA